MGSDDLKSKNTSSAEPEDEPIRAGGPDTVRSPNAKGAEAQGLDAGATPQDPLRAGGPDTVRSANPEDSQGTQESFRHPISKDTKGAGSENG